MILPINIYGQPILRKIAEPVTRDYPNFQQIVADLWETMYHSDGVGLAAPQIGLSIRLFVVDTKELNEDDENVVKFKRTFINAKILEREGDEWLFKEGCLSIPGLREEVKRKSRVRIQYVDENFVAFDEYYEGVVARVIQHEYDHLEGTMFVDHLSPLRKRLIKNRLLAISRGQFEADYRTVINRKLV